MENPWQAPGQAWTPSPWLLGLSQRELSNELRRTQAFDHSEGVRLHQELLRELLRRERISKEQQNA